MKNKRRILTLMLAVLMLALSVSSCSSCKKDDGPKGPSLSNERDHLVLSTGELDGVFNPFYSSSATDSSIVGMTQISMLGSDKDGKVAFGENEACVVLDYETESVTNSKGETEQTIYRFVLKNNLKFSNGSPLTMKDVLFNLYTYLDPSYYGSATIYSTDIVGLKDYRTQTHNVDEQDDFDAPFNALAQDRIRNLDSCLELVLDAHKGSSLTDAEMEAALAAEAADLGPNYATVVEDYQLAKKYFKEELERDYRYAKGTAEDISFTDKNGNKVHLTTDTEAFLYNEGFITWNKKEYKFEYSLGEKSKDWDEKQAIDAIYSSYIPNQTRAVISVWGTANELFTRFSYLEKQKYFENLTDKIPNVSGIKYANRSESVTVNGKEYAVPTFNDEDGSVASGNEVLEITINKVDPKAIWNFGFTVAPMYYYSTEEEIAKFDYESNFGVKFGSVDFQDQAIKNPAKIGVPVGAGPYKATSRSEKSEGVTAGDFYEANVVHFERNEHFLFNVKIKYIDYQVVSTNLMLDTLYSGGVHFVEPSCKQENIDNINSRKKDGFDSVSVRTNGYGYIGINAGKVPNLNVRRAIMHAINTQHAVDYYLGYSSAIHRPMTLASWAYPTGAEPYYEFDATGEICERLVQEAGYTKNADGIYEKNEGGVRDTLSYVFTIAGDTTDHPAYNSLKQAAEILNAHGFDIEVKTDINALQKLNNGDLTVWAAAWGSTIDPDMYQVYHIDSTAGSTANWGYREIRRNSGGRYDTERGIVDDLSDIIDQARETLNETRRKELYAEALDLVMKLAVELPTYQRSDLFAYNSNVIDASTLTPAEDLTPYNGPLSRIWEVSLKESN